MLFVGEFAVLNGLKPSAEVLSSVPKCRKVVMCLTEKIHVLYKFHLGRSYSAAGHEFYIN